MKKNDQPEINGLKNLGSYQPPKIEPFGDQNQQQIGNGGVKPG